MPLTLLSSPDAPIEATAPACPFILSPSLGGSCGIAAWAINSSAVLLFKILSLAFLGGVNLFFFLNSSIIFFNNISASSSLFSSINLLKSVKSTLSSISSSSSGGKIASFSKTDGTLLIPALSTLTLAVTMTVALSSINAILSCSARASYISCGTSSFKLIEDIFSPSLIISIFPAVILSS